MIKIEVTGNSIAEVSDKLLVIGAALQSPPQTVPLGVAREALQAQRDAAWVKPAGAEDVEVEPAKPTVGTEAAKRTRKAKSVGDEGNAPVTSTADTALSATPEREVVSEPVVETPERAYDFDKEVAPLVLRVVQSRGPDAIRAILDQFGVQRASQVDPARYGELVGLLEEALS